MKHGREKAMAVFRAIVLCLVVSLMFSCGTLGGKKDDKDTLLKHIEAFNTALRWEDYKIASTWIPAQQQEEFWKLADALQGHIRIMDYEIRTISFEEGDIYGTVILRFRYYFKDAPNLETKTVRQQWHYLETEETWQLSQFDMSVFLPEK